jgi:phage FluMu protein Com
MQSLKCLRCKKTLLHAGESANAILEVKCPRCKSLVVFVLTLTEVYATIKEIRASREP